MDDATSRWEPDGDDEYESARGELKRRFVSWASHGDDAFDPDLGEELLHYKWGYIDGHLTRWRRSDLDEVYLELYPAKVIIEAEGLDDELEDARTFLTFLAETGLLDEGSEPIEALLEHLEDIAGQFKANMGDPARYSLGKRLMTSAAAEGVRPDDQASLNAFIERFNARPRAVRDAVLDGGPKSWPRPSGRFTPPGTPPRRPSGKRRKRH